MVKVDNADKVLPPIQLPASCQLQNGQILKSDHPSLAELDLDGDGDIDMEDLHKLVHLKRSQETLIKTQKITVLVLSCIIIGVGVGLAVELKAAQSAIEGARVGRTVPHVEVPLALQVPSGTAGTEESEHDTAVSVDFTDKDGHAIRTDRSYDKLLLTSELPDSAFDQLEQLKIEGPDGSVNFKTTGFARYNSEDSRCGSVVVVFTAVGFVQFDGAGMTFSETVVGAFQRAGFVVSANRKRRRSVGRSGRSVDESIHTLVGVSKIFGEFRFLQNLDLSELSCGDEVPEVKAPFDGDNTDVQTQEEKLILCGDETDVESPCPAYADLMTDSHGRTYFKRVIQTRSKYVEGAWRSIRSTTIPELDNPKNAGVADEFRGGQFVELLVGKISKTYEFFPKSSSKQTTKCSFEKSDGVDLTDSLEANTADEVGAYKVDFVGYDVFNNHYVKHFRIFMEGAVETGIDYYESYEEKRPYSLGLLAPHVYTTYESIKTDGDVEPDFLQGDGYPPLDVANVTEFLNYVSCTDDTEWQKFVAEEADGNATLALNEALRSAAMPSLQSYLSVPFVLAEFKDQVTKRSEAARVGIEGVSAVLAFDNGRDRRVDVLGGQERANRDVLGGQERTKRGVSFESCQHQPWIDEKTWTLGHPRVSFTLLAQGCVTPTKLFVEAKLDGSEEFHGVKLSAGGSLKIEFDPYTSSYPVVTASAFIEGSLPTFPTPLKLTLEAEYKKGQKGYNGWGKLNHEVTLTGKITTSVCGDWRRNRRQAAVSAPDDTSKIDTATKKGSRRAPLYFGVPGQVASSYQAAKYYDSRIPGGIFPKCPKTMIGIGMANTYVEPTFLALRAAIPMKYKAQVIKLYITTLGFEVEHDIPFRV